MRYLIPILSEDGHLRIDMEVPLSPGPVEVVLVVAPTTEPQSAAVDPETARQHFLASAGYGASGDPDSSHRIDELLYDRKP